MAKQSEFQYFGQYTGNLKTYTVHKRSGDVIRTDAPTDNQGEGKHFSPTDLLANALGTCIVTVMGIKARAEKISMDGTTFEIHKTMAANPRRIAKVHVRIMMPDVAYSDREKKILEKAAHHCPVVNSLHPDFEEVIEIVW
jgi:uncharacterized OsmC-like protein